MLIKRLRLSPRWLFWWIGGGPAVLYQTAVGGAVSRGMCCYVRAPGQCNERTASDFAVALQDLGIYGSPAQVGRRDWITTVTTSVYQLPCAVPHKHMQSGVRLLSAT